MRPHPRDERVLPMVLALVLVVCIAACSFLRTGRVEVTEGIVEHPEGDGRLSAVGLSFGVPPAEPDDSREERMAEEIAYLRSELAKPVVLAPRPDPKEQRMGLEIARLREEAEDLEKRLGFATRRAEAVEHFAPEHEPAWWEDPQTFLYVVLSVLTALGVRAGVKKYRAQVETTDA